MISRLSVRRGPLDVEVDRRGAADQGVRAGHRVHRARAPGRPCRRRRRCPAPRSGCPRCTRRRPITTGSVTLAGSMPSTSASAAATSVAWSAFAMTTTGEPAPPGKCAESTFSPSIDGWVAAERLLGGQARRVERDDARRTRRRGSRTCRSRWRGAGARCGRRRAPRSRARTARRRRACGVRGQKIHRPQVTSSAGSRVSMTSSATPTPTAATGPRPAVEFMVANSRHEHADGHRGAAGDDRRAGAVQGQGHRLVPVAVLAQLLAVARDEQQGVVRPRAEHQDREDAGALRVDGEVVVVGQQVDERLRDGERDARGDDRQDPQDRAAVGDEQDDDDDRDGRVQQGAVDALERRGRVGGAAGRARDVDVQPVGAVLGGGAQVVDRVGGEVPAVRAEVERDDDLRGLRRPPTGSGRSTSPSRVSERAELRGVRRDRPRGRRR